MKQLKFDASKFLLSASSLLPRGFLGEDVIQQHLAQCPAQIKYSTDARYHYDEDRDDGHGASMLGTIPGTGRKGLLIPQKIYGTWHSPSSIQVPARQNWPSFTLTRLSRQDRVYSGSRPTTGLEKKG